MIAFTICSNNYLPMARILGESLIRHNPGIRFIIGLVDVLDSRIDYKAFAPFEILPLDQIGVPDLEGMARRYSIVELNTAAKPFYFRYLFENYAAEKDLKVCYFDPDICVYAPLEPIEQALDRSDVLLTPHVLSPLALDAKHPGEHTFLNFGIYNLGFCGMRRSRTADAVINWWAERLAEHCRNDVANGIFVDQLWMNLAPIYFENVEISRHPGLNVAYWNLHERMVRSRNGRWEVNDSWPLVFFHFSDLQMSDSPGITKAPTRFTLVDKPHMSALFAEYRSKLVANDISRFRQIPCAYIEKRATWLEEQRRLYYRKHPLRLLVAGLKRVVPRQMKTFVRGS